MSEDKAFINICGELYDMKTALVSGRLRSDDSETSLYFGKMDLDELHTMLYYTNRTVLKLLTTQFDVSFENADNFLFSAMTEALVKEDNIKNNREPNQDVERILRKSSKSN